ncbi:GNAT family N-acetyltransferase [Kaistella flava (ex Peng et al. 2021)]|nr:GNAT family N-acetyltransferase [Kaistella flava (ex Peng et al. 2021)]
MISQHYDMINIEQNDQTFDIYYDAEKAGFMEYNLKEGILEIIHTEVFEEFGGKGLGKELVKTAVEFAKKNNLKIIPLCPYSKRMIEKTPEFRELLA